MVSKIVCRAGWYVDALALHLLDGSILAYGDSAGHAQDPVTLNLDEHLVSVEQVSAEKSRTYLGIRLIFSTSHWRRLPAVCFLLSLQQS